MVDLARRHTTVSVERAVLRLAGLTGADPDGIPWVNRLVDASSAELGLGHGVAVPVFHALRPAGARSDPAGAEGGGGFGALPVPEGAAAAARTRRGPRSAGIRQIDRRRAERDRMIARSATRRSGRGST